MTINPASNVVSKAEILSEGDAQQLKRASVSARMKCTKPEGEKTVTTLMTGCVRKQEIAEKKVLGIAA
jgi:hypothetical protein